MDSQHLGSHGTMRKNLGANLVVYVVACALLFAGIYILALQVSVQEEATDSNEAHNRFAHLHASQLKQSLDSQKNLLALLAKNNTFINQFLQQPDGKANLASTLSSQSFSIPSNISRLVILNHSGQVLQDTKPNANSGDKHNWAKRVLQGSAVELKLHNSHSQTLSIALPITAYKTKQTDPSLFGIQGTPGSGVIIGYFNIENIMPPSQVQGDFALLYQKDKIEIIKDFGLSQPGKPIPFTIEPYELTFHYIYDDITPSPPHKTLISPAGLIIGTLLIIGVLLLAGRRILLKPYQALAQSHAAIMSITEGISYIDHNGGYQYTNQAYCDITGYNSKELEQQDWKALIHPHDHSKAQQAFDEMLSVGKANISIRGHKKDGAVYHQNITMVKENNTQNHSKGFYFFVTDITDVKQSEQTATDLIEELSHSNVKLEQFTAIASHDLKAPLRGIKQLASWIKQDSHNALPLSSRQHFSLIENRIVKMEKLLDDLLAYSQTAKSKPLEKSTNCDTFLGNIAESYIKPFGFTHSLDAPSNTLPIPEKPLEIVLRNLIDNAIKHHHQSVGHIHIGYEKSANEHIITVNDDGPGIMNKAVKWQEKNKNASSHSSGIGLSIIQKTLARYKAHIRFNSNTPIGTSIQIMWPHPTLQYDLAQYKSRRVQHSDKAKAG